MPNSRPYSMPTYEPPLARLRPPLRAPALMALCVLYGLVASPVFADTALWSEAPRPGPAPLVLQQLNEALTTLADTLLPAVVSLRIYHGKDAADLPKNHPPLPQEIPGFSTGSGVIIRSDGLVLTNHHVVEEAETGGRLEVLLYDGVKTSATILGQDPIGDLALLQIETDRTLPVAPLGSSAALRAGEFVVALGSPFGFEHTITFGIVSAMKRHFLRSGVVGGYIQTDAAINVGNSGGPLVNMRGEIVGINVATVGRGELGFAIPVDAIKFILPQLYASGEVKRGWLGVQIRPLDAARAGTLGLETPQGVYVHAVLENHPAQQAGVSAGDVIISFDGNRVASPADLQRVVAATPVGKTVRVQLLRNQDMRTVELTVGQMPDDRQ